MQINYGKIEGLPNYVAWVCCKPEDLNSLKEVFDVKNYYFTVAVKPNYNPITCDTRTLYNPPAPTWGVDVWKRETDGRLKGLSSN